MQQQKMCHMSGSRALGIIIRAGEGEVDHLITQPGTEASSLEGHVSSTEARGSDRGQGQ